MNKTACRGLAALAAVAAISTAAAAQNVVAKRQVSEDWFDYEIHWTEGAPSYTAKWMVLTDATGTILVCGAGAHGGGKFRQNTAVLEDLGFFIGDDLVMTGMEFFARAKSRSGIVGTQAACVSTGKNAANYTSRTAKLKSTRPQRLFR